MAEYSEKKQENRHVNDSKNTTQTQSNISYNYLRPFQLSTEKLKLDVSTKKVPDTINPVQAFGLIDTPKDTAPIKHWTPEILQRQQKENKTGLPDNLKSGIENLSGHSMDDVKVHYNSSKPTQLNAHAYAQGTDIHLASGQEKHLPHEAWHVVQQKEGRVKPTMQMQGVNINDDTGLEKEADVMGGKALQMKGKNEKTPTVLNSNTNKAIQLYVADVSKAYLGKKIKVYYSGGEPDDKGKEKVLNTLYRHDSNLIYQKGLTVSYLAKEDENMGVKLANKDHLYVYDVDYSDPKKPKFELQSDIEISDITNDYDVTLGCVLQALIAMKGGDIEGQSTAKDLHDYYWASKPAYKFYDLDEIYPLIYAEQGLTAVNAGNEKLDDIFEDLEVGEKYIMEAGGELGHNFCIKVKMVGGGNQRHKEYDLIEDPSNAHARGDVKINKYWKE